MQRSGIPSRPEGHSPSNLRLDQGHTELLFRHDYPSNIPQPKRDSVSVSTSHFRVIS
jgi:hypothetical protein